MYSTSDLLAILSFVIVFVGMVKVSRAGGHGRSDIETC